MAKATIAPTDPGQEVLNGFYDRITTRTWSDREVASLCITQGLVGLVAKANGRHPALTRWRRAYRAFVDAAVTGRLDYADSRERMRLKELVEGIRLAFGESSRRPAAKKKAGARQRKGVA